MATNINIMQKLLKYIYKLSPIFLQNFGISLYGLFWKIRRLGGVFKNEIKTISKRNHFTENAWIDFQDNELKKLIWHSFKHVPFYKEEWNRLGLNEKVLEHLTVSQINLLPFLEKESLRKFGTTKLLSEVKDKGQFYSSSGSTGTPTQIYFSKSFHQKWSAIYEVRVRNWAGVNHTMSRGMIGGRRVVPDGDAQPPFYRYNFFEKQVYFSAYHLSEKTVDNYNQGLIKYKVEYLVGYANSIYFWADFVIKKKIDVPKMKAVLTSSEKLTPTMRKTIEKCFQCKVYDGYSGVEACGLISENQYGELLFSPDSGIMEVIKEDGTYAQPGESGELVFTGLLNFDQPLIRYKIGDRVTLSKNQVSKSGMHMPIIESIDGRVEDIVVGKDGRKMVRFHGLFVDLTGLITAQIIQHAIENIEIKLVVDKEFDKKNEAVVKNRLFSQLGNINVKISYVNDIPKTENGKIKAVISYVKS
jgi:phenylacetate-CoA ligase